MLYPTTSPNQSIGATVNTALYVITRQTVAVNTRQIWTVIAEQEYVSIDRM
jgi:hypothetical protein